MLLEPPARLRGPRKPLATKSVEAPSLLYTLFHQLCDLSFIATLGNVNLLSTRSIASGVIYLFRCESSRGNSFKLSIAKGATRVKQNYYRDMAGAAKETAPKMPSLEERRARRQERREKQRHANAGRAVEMRAGDSHSKRPRKHALMSLPLFMSYGSVG